jgi:hypothetical protein
MNILCLCPTYGRPRLVSNALACFLAQDYPAQQRKLLILDDADQIARQEGQCWEVQSTPSRFSSLPAKYNAMLATERVLSSSCWDAVAVWDDDDVYLPNYLSAHAEALRHREWSHPEFVWTDYTGRLAREPAAGRFHGSVVVKRELLSQLGGWIETPRADFDQQFMAALKRFGPPARPQPVDRPGYVFRWQTTQHSHCQGLMSSPDNDTWYGRVRISDPSHVTQLVPTFDAVTRNYYEQLAG